VDDVLEDADIYAASSSVKSVDWTFDQPVNNIRITFRGTSSPDIYGIALDGLNGIAVDNIAMRGNAGLLFTSLNKENLRQHFEELNIKLIILQFGGNIVPDVTDTYISYYERRMYQQIMRIKEIIPDVPIIVIGVADMSIKEKTRYVSYPRLDKVRDALKNASFRANVAYWDLYEAMGGDNSMPSWVFANPPLASKDFVHFNPRGIRIISNMFYNALIYEYNLFKRSQETAEE
jgi:lysophospholipase L1-like esterase